MSMNRLVHMLLRMLMRRGVNWGVRRATRKPGQGSPTPKSRVEREAVKRGRQAARLLRRMGR